jgi:acylphosphatase
MAIVRVRAVVSGRVQGVWYRDSARREAEAAGLSGWAANRADGSVELVVEGERDAVDRFLAWARQGPPRARVDDVRVSDEAPTGEGGFRVR